MPCTSLLVEEGLARLIMGPAGVCWYCGWSFHVHLVRLPSRRRVARIVEYLGGKVSQKLTQKCTHLSMYPGPCASQRNGNGHAA
jgi:hypothetical protein